MTVKLPLLISQPLMVHRLDHGGMIAAYFSNVFLHDSHLSYARGAVGGAIMVQEFSSLSVYNSVFEDNYSEMGSAIFKYGPGNVSIEHCTFTNNTGNYGSIGYLSTVNICDCQEVPVKSFQIQTA